jgi:hypothetical protein
LTKVLRFINEEKIVFVTNGAYYSLDLEYPSTAHVLMALSSEGCYWEVVEPLRRWGIVGKL